jgi:lipid-A-disaccharide synthase-like uncharacterized protein|tara:strand:- start:18 stop:338 length:321 start_codon:yes stop_codon:yes gene_type:complete
MTKALLILVIVFTIIEILHFFLMKIIKSAESKKSNYRKLFWYFYGILMSVTGLVNLIEKSEWNIIFIIQLSLGILIITLNFLRKIETKNPTLNVRLKWWALRDSNP